MDTTTPKPPVVIIDQSALDNIADIARRIFAEQSEPFNAHRVMFRALSDYMLRKGVTPNFQVKSAK